MAQTGIDFSAIKREEFMFTSRSGTTFTVNDAIPIEDIIDSSLALAVVSELVSFKFNETTHAETVKTDVQAKMLEAKTQAIHAVGGIFRNSLPDTTDETIAQEFSLEECLQLISFFISRRSQTLLMPVETISLPANQPIA